VLVDVCGSMGLFQVAFASPTTTATTLASFAQFDDGGEDSSWSSFSLAALEWMWEWDR
jgi:hypothetical protein